MHASLKTLRPFGLAVWQLRSGKWVAGLVWGEDSVCNTNPRKSCGNSTCDSVRRTLAKMAQAWK
jgi:hypothetical protein